MFRYKTSCSYYAAARETNKINDNSLSDRNTISLTAIKQIVQGDDGWGF